VWTVIESDNWFYGVLTVQIMTIVKRMDGIGIN